MLTKPPGIEDIFPDRIVKWNRLVNAARYVFGLYNYREIIIPVMEYTELFTRGLGNESDIVTKEMFTFEDRGNRSLTLRPEGTASVVRAYIENGEYNRLSSAKFFYTGPMFRAERPQRGRLRQFNQFGAEFFGSSNPYYDFEIIAMGDTITKSAGIPSYTLKLNSIGCPECRKGYIADIHEYYTARKERLCEDCRRRLEKNALRLLDCKNESCVALKKDAPLLGQHLCEECREHHAAVKGHCDAAGIAYEDDPYLVRGLDYYTKTTFEFVSSSLGGQNAFAGGGRYDELVARFGGSPTPAVGFAAGIERMLLLVPDAETDVPGVDYYVLHSGGTTLAPALRLTASLRSMGCSVVIDPDAGGFKSQMKKANREKAGHALIIGEEEAASNTVTVKDMTQGTQTAAGYDAFLSSIRADREKRNG